MGAAHAPERGRVGRAAELVAVGVKVTVTAVSVMLLCTTAVSLLVVWWRLVAQPKGDKSQRACAFAG